MNEKLDLVQTLKDCPKGTKFYSSYLGKNVFFIEIYNNCIKCEYTSQIDSLNSIVHFKKDGSLYSGGECMLFPSKEQRDWSKWQKPFVDGDIITSSAGCVAIFSNLEKDNRVLFHCLYGQGVKLIAKKGSGIGCSDNCRFATEHEKEILFTTLKDNGYKWNPETKTLEKLIVPKFKVGDKIRHKTANIDYVLEISRVYNDSYGIVGCGWMVSMEYQNEYELVPNKFNPKTLQPFDKVLVADSLSKAWYAVFLSHIDEESKTYPFAAGIVHYRYCIPYNDDTKHLVGKPGEPPEFYKYWEE